MSENYDLPEDVLAVIRALMDAGEVQWRSLAKVTAVCLGETDKPRMVVYKAIAIAAEKGVSTIRLYHRLETEYGNLLDTLPTVRFDHLVCALVESKMRKVDVEAVIQERLKESDKWGGRLPPPDVWRAQIASGFRAFDWDAAFGRVGAQLATLLTHSNEQAPKRVEVVRRMLEEWERCDEV